MKTSFNAVTECENVEILHTDSSELKEDLPIVNSFYP